MKERYPTTRADEYRASAKDSIDEAIRALAAIVIDKVDGHDAYNVSYRRELRQVLNDLIEILEKI